MLKLHGYTLVQRLNVLVLRRHNHPFRRRVHVLTQPRNRLSPETVPSMHVFRMNHASADAKPSSMAFPDVEPAPGLIDASMVAFARIRKRNDQPEPWIRLL